MTHPRHFLRVPAAILTVALLAAAGCGSSDSSGDPATPGDTAAPADTAASGDAAPATVASTPADTAAEAEADVTAAPADGGESSGGVSLALSDGRSWTLESSLCTFDPDATGPAAAIINIGAANDDGVELNIIEAWPFDGSTDKGTPFLGSFVDENDEVLVFLKDGAAMVDDEVEVTGGYYANVFYQDGDPFDGTYTVRCRP